MAFGKGNGSAPSFVMNECNHITSSTGTAECWCKGFPVWKLKLYACIRLHFYETTCIYVATFCEEHILYLNNLHINNNCLLNTKYKSCLHVNGIAQK